MLSAWPEGGKTDSPKGVRARETDTERYRDRETERGRGRDRQTDRGTQTEMGKRWGKRGGGDRDIEEEEEIRGEMEGGGRMKEGGGRREDVLQEKEGQEEGRERGWRGCQGRGERPGRAGPG